jgi:hypothetical protein
METKLQHHNLYRAFMLQQFGNLSSNLM